MKPSKKCPKCNHGNWPGAKTCKECGHKFPFKKRKKAAPPAPELPDATFSAGLSIEGGLVVNFHDEGTFTAFNAAQTDLIRRVLQAPTPEPVAAAE